MVVLAAGRRRATRRASGWTDRVQDVLVQAGVAVGHARRRSSGASVVTALLVGTAVSAVTRAPAIAACFAVIAGAAPAALVRSRARRRRTALREVWPEVVDHLASGVRAGLSLPEAVGQLGDRGPVELREPFRAFAEDYRATGRFGDCLDALKERLADPVADRIVEALRITRDVGGTDLGRLLRTLSTFLREDARTRGELEARQSWTVNAARLAVAAPWIVLALLATRPEAAAGVQLGRRHGRAARRRRLLGRRLRAHAADRAAARTRPGCCGERRDDRRARSAGLGGLGAALVVWRLLARRVTLDDRLAPYLRVAAPDVGAPARAGAEHAVPDARPAARPGHGRRRPARRAARLADRGRAPPARAGRAPRDGRAVPGGRRCCGASSGWPAGCVLALVLASARGTPPLVLALLVLVVRGDRRARARRAAHPAGPAARGAAARRAADRRRAARARGRARGRGRSARSSASCASTRGALADELARTLADARAGTPLTRALEGLADRTGLPPLTRFAEGVAVAVERGTPLADVLRAQAQDVRESGRRALMEAGGRKEVLMMVPVVFLILPVTVAFAVFPSIAVLRLSP